MEDLLSRQRKEQRELQSRITQKKKNATKKTRKGINDECEVLERELAEKHQLEQASLETPDSLDHVQSTLQDLSIAPRGVEGTEPGVTSRPEDDLITRNGTAETQTTTPPDTQASARSKKPNRQKARLARRAAEQEALSNAAAIEAQNLPDRREQELSAMKRHIQALQLEEIMIRPDGHCLFSACATGMPSKAASDSAPGQQPYQKVRVAAADFMTAHPDDFSAFLEEPLDTYVKKIRDTAEWGGELELQAIARSFQVKINVLQADGRIEKITSDPTDPESDTIWLAYYRHSFGLGEHYNALKKAD